MKFRKVFSWAALATIAIVVVLGYKIAENENRRTRVIAEVKSYLGMEK